MQTISFIQTIRSSKSWGWGWGWGVIGVLVPEEQAVMRTHNKLLRSTQASPGSLQVLTCKH